MFQAEMKYKFRSTLPRNCVVEKVVQLAKWEFDAFSADLLKDWSFIKDNQEHMFSELSNVAHCLLVTGDGHKDGVLVNSEGYNYARYACHIPDAQALLAASRYPSLADFTNKLVAMADYLVEQAMEMKPGDTAPVLLHDLESISGIGVSHNTAIVHALKNMLNDRPEIADWKLEGGEFTLTPAPTLAEPEMTDEPEQSLQM
jgi:hypothetical protein